MRYRTCPYCGANLDAGEKCDCRENEDTVQQTEKEVPEIMEENRNPLISD